MERKCTSYLCKVKYNNKVIYFNVHFFSLLEPFPSWSWNSLDSPANESLRSVLGFEIDSENNIWILDQGIVSGNEAEEQSMKIVIWSLNKNKLEKVNED